MDAAFSVFQILIVIIFIVISVLAKSSVNQKNSGTSYKTRAPQGKTTYNTKTSYSKVSQNIQKQLRDQSFKRHNEGYDQHTLDYCDSNLSRTQGGITFRNKPVGMDELYYLHRYNDKRERELQAEIDRKSNLDL